MTQKKVTRRVMSWHVTRTRTRKHVPDVVFAAVVFVNVTKSHSMNEFTDSSVNVTTSVAIDPRGKFVPVLTMVPVTVVSASVTMIGLDQRVNAETRMILVPIRRREKFALVVVNVTAESVVASNHRKDTSLVSFD